MRIVISRPAAASTCGLSGSPSSCLSWNKFLLRSPISHSHNLDLKWIKYIKRPPISRSSYSVDSTVRCSPSHTPRSHSLTPPALVWSETHRFPETAHTSCWLQALLLFFQYASKTANYRPYISQGLSISERTKYLRFHEITLYVLGISLNLFLLLLLELVFNSSLSELFLDLLLILMLFSSHQLHILTDHYL